MAFVAQLGEHCTGIAEVVASNPAQSLKTKLISLPGLFARRLKTCIMDRVFGVLFSAECTIGMVRGLTPLWHYGTMALWH